MTNVPSAQNRVRATLRLLGKLGVLPLLAECVWLGANERLVDRCVHDVREDDRAADAWKKCSLAQWDVSK